MPEHLDNSTLAAYVDRELPISREQQIEAHLEGCQLCRARAERHRGLQALAARLPREPLPAHLVGRIQQAVAARTWWRGLRSATMVSGLLGLALVVLALPEAAAAAANTLATLDAQGLTALVNTLVAAPSALPLSWAGDGPVGLREGAGEALLLGVVLLTGAAFGGLAELLHSGSSSRQPG